MTIKRFETRVLLTVTTGRLLTRSKGDRDNGIGDLYELLGWMTDDEPFTHQLPRFAEECKPWLLRWFPELQKATDALPLLDTAKGPAEQRVEEWLGKLELCGLPREYDVPKIPMDDHTRRDPVDELCGMVGDDKVVVVNVNREARG